MFEEGDHEHHHQKKSVLKKVKDKAKKIKHTIQKHGGHGQEQHEHEHGHDHEEEEDEDEEMFEDPEIHGAPSMFHNFLLSFLLKISTITGS